MQLIHDHLHPHDCGLPCVPLAVDRLTLAKRRWRGAVADGAEFGFDLEHHLHDGDVFFVSEQAVYRIGQKPEPVLELNMAESARVGWVIGNLHFPLQLVDGIVRVPDDPALRQLFEREGWPFEIRESVFRPLTGAHHH